MTVKLGPLERTFDVADQLCLIPVVQQVVGLATIASNSEDH